MQKSLLQTLLRKRLTTHEDFTDSGLNKCLGALDLTMLGIGAIIGTGIFVLTGIAAATQSGPAVILSFVFAGLACAIPAVMAYNIFVNRVRLFTGELEGFANELIGSMAREGLL